MVVRCSEQRWIAITVSTQRVPNTTTTLPARLSRLFPVTSLPEEVPRCASVNLVTTRWITILSIRSHRPSTTPPLPTPGRRHPPIGGGRPPPVIRRCRGRPSATFQGPVRRRRRRHRELSLAAVSTGGRPGRPSRRRPVSGRGSATVGRRRSPLLGSPLVTRQQPSARQTYANQPSI